MRKKRLGFQAVSRIVIILLRRRLGYGENKNIR
jgi:hypothetical protein